MTGGRGAPLRHGMPGEPLGCRSIEGRRARDLDISAVDVIYSSMRCLPSLTNIRLGRIKRCPHKVGWVRCVPRVVQCCRARDSGNLVCVHHGAFCLKPRKLESDIFWIKIRNQKSHEKHLKRRHGIDSIFCTLQCMQSIPYILLCHIRFMVWTF